MESGAKAIGTTDESRWFDELDAHRQSVHAFVTTALEADDGAGVAHLGAMLWPYWTRRATDGSDWLERSVAVVARSSTPPSEDLGLLLYGAGVDAIDANDPLVTLFPDCWLPLRALFVPQSLIHR